jgi:hypothetical protein
LFLRVRAASCQWGSSAYLFNLGVAEEGDHMATYREIQNWIKSRYGFSCKTCWIAHMKEVCGLPVKISHRRYSPDKRLHPCPESKQEAVREAFKYFGLI